METCGVPVEMISLCKANGELQPLRFRMTAQTGQMRRINVDEVVSVRPVEYVGVEAVIYLCKIHLDGQERLLELKYLIRSHSWRLFRWIY